MKNIFYIQARFYAAAALFFFLMAAGPEFISAAEGQADYNRILRITGEQDALYDRIVIYLKRAASYKSRFLDKNPKTQRPYRLYIDLLNTALTSRNAAPVLQDVSNITAVRVAQRDAKTTRIVLDIAQKIYREDYEISQYFDPARIEIRLRAKNKRRAKRVNQIFKKSAATTTIPAPRTLPEKIEPRPEPPLQKKAAPVPKKPRAAQLKKTDVPKAKSDSDCIIVIDAGHGGKDPGAIGYKGIMEKDVCLPIAVELKKMLDKNMKCTTIMTRTGDDFISLKARAAIANKYKADLFVSIHANSHEDASLTGIETYYLNFSSDATARKVAARENFTTPSKVSDLELILFDLMQSDKINRSSIFAGHIHNALVVELQQRYKKLRNLGVKHAPMRVLIEVEMTGVLIETAFVSNPTEAKRLQNSAYHKSLARAIFNGIRDFNKNGNKTALYIKKD